MGGLGGGESDIPDIGLAANVEDLDNGLIIDVLIAPDNDGLVREDLSQLAQPRGQFIAGDRLVIEDEGAVGPHVDHLLNHWLGSLRQFERADKYDSAPWQENIEFEPCRRSRRAGAVER